MGTDTDNPVKGRPHGRRSGPRTLVAILIPVGATLVLASVVLAIFAVRNYNPAEEHKNRAFCMHNLVTMGAAIELYHKTVGHYPRTRSGIRFLLAPLEARILDPASTPLEDIVRNTYACPGDVYAMDALADVAKYYGDPANIDPRVFSYAGRNTIDYPLDRKKAAIEVIACDAGGADGCGLNHRDAVNVLYLDGSVEFIDLTELPGDVRENFKVGPDSPIPALRVLNKDL